jgi:hypothetical protein
MTMKHRDKVDRDGLELAISTGTEPGIGIRTFDKTEKMAQDFYSPKFVFDKISIEDLKLNIDDTQNEKGTYSIFIDEFYSEPLRSYFLWWDILFRSNLKATVDASELRIVNKRNDSLKETTWMINDVSATTLNSLVGGPFSYFRKGQVDVEVRDTWDIESTTEVNMNWKLRVTNPETIVPKETPALLKPLAKAVVEQINDKEEPWEFGFELVLREAQFAGSATLDAQRIWNETIPIILKQAAQKFSLSEDSVKEGAKKVFESFRGFLKNREEDQANP